MAPLKKLENCLVISTSICHRTLAIEIGKQLVMCGHSADAVQLEARGRLCRDLFLSNAGWQTLLNQALPVEYPEISWILSSLLFLLVFISQIFSDKTHKSVAKMSVFFYTLDFQMWSTSPRHTRVHFVDSSAATALCTRRFTEPTFRTSSATRCHTHYGKTKSFATLLPFGIFWRPQLLNFLSGCYMLLLHLSVTRKFVQAGPRERG